MAPALGLVGVKERLSIGEAAGTDLINSTRIKLLGHKDLCCLRRLSNKRRSRRKRRRMRMRRE